MKELPSFSKSLLKVLGLFKYKTKDGMDIKILNSKNPFHKLQLKYYLRKKNMKFEKSHLYQHAIKEFKALGYKPIKECEPGPDKQLQEDVLALLKEFYNQGHSGTSSTFCLEYFRRLAKLEPASPLTGEDDEWNLVETTKEYQLYQNNRCSRVFKEIRDNKSISYDLDGYIFYDENDYTFSSKYSRKKIIFPYLTSTQYINVVSYEVDKETEKPEKNTGWWYTEYPVWLLEQYEKDFKDF